MLWAFPIAVVASTQTLESTLLFPLSPPQALFRQGVIFSMEIAKEAT